MKKTFVLLLCFFSSSFGKDYQINVNGYFDLESNCTASLGGVDIDSKLKPGISFGGNYLFKLKEADLLIGPFFHYFNNKEYKGAGSIAKDGYISFGGIVKKNIKPKLNAFGGLGFNIYDRDMPGYSFSTKGGLTYFLGVGYLIQKNISAEVMYRSMSGELISDGNTTDVTHTGISLGVNYQL